MPEPVAASGPEALAAIAVGDFSALAGDLAAIAGETAPILLLPPPPAPAAVAEMARLLDAAAASRGLSRLDRLRPASGLRAGIGAPGAWTAVETAPGAVRFREALLPRGVAAGEGVAVSEIGGPFAGSPCGLLASFAHPRQRLAARLAADAAPAAELAASIPLRAALLAGTWHGAPVAAACSTLLAAQLLWRALERLRPDSEAPGPWERPETQRLTALDQRPQTPGALAVVLHGTGPAADAMGRLLHDRLGGISLRDGPQ